MNAYYKYLSKSKFEQRLKEYIPRKMARQKKMTYTTKNMKQK